MLTAVASKKAQDHAGGTSPAHWSAAVAGIVLACVTAGWIASGGLGFVSVALRHELTLLLLIGSLLGGWLVLRAETGGSPQHSRRRWWWLAIAAVGAGVLNIPQEPAINVLTPALVLAVLAALAPGRSRHALGAAAVALVVVSVFLLLLQTSSVVYWVVDGVGNAFGRTAGWIAGQPLEIGATYAAFQYPIAMVVIFGLLLPYARPPRLRAALFATGAILVAHFVYLLVLAWAADLKELIPPVSTQPESDVNYVRASNLANTLRAMIPWNLPIVALVLHGITLLAAIVWWPWDDRRGAEASRTAGASAHPGDSDRADLSVVALPALVAAFLPAAGLLVVSPPAIQGKHIVAFGLGSAGAAADNAVQPGLPQAGQAPPKLLPSFGMLGKLVAKLGGTFSTVDDATSAELTQADAVLVIDPRGDWPTARTDPLLAYVRGGGTLVVAAGPRDRRRGAASCIEPLLEPAVLGVRFDALAPAAAQFEQCLEPMAHPAALGLAAGSSEFGIRLASSIDVGPTDAVIVTSPYAVGVPGTDFEGVPPAEYRAGERLGDLVLAAESRLGRGRVIAVGATTPFEDQTIPRSHAFVARLLGYAAQPATSPQAWWRQLVALLLAAGVVVLIARRPSPAKTAAVAVTLALSTWLSLSATRAAARVIPAEDRSPNQKVALLDASHFESFPSAPDAPSGVGRFSAVLAENGYLPLMAPDLGPDRLAAADLVVLIAPWRPFSKALQADLQAYVESGGDVLCLVGAEDAAASAPLLRDFDLRVPTSPVPPGGTQREPEPLGAYAIHLNLQKAQLALRFYAAWPVECNSQPHEVLVSTPEKLPIVVRRLMGSGSFTLVGDSHFACNENLAPEAANDNALFWRWYLSRLAGNQWLPPDDVSAPAAIDRPAPRRTTNNALEPAEVDELMEPGDRPIGAGESLERGAATPLEGDRP
ncbi:MAG: DUF4350 domain-containing protein [Planctomycetota bacterium]